MIARCYKPNTRHFHNYGGRGIRVCESWLNSFEAFLADMGPRPSSRHTVDRIDGDGHYEPANCRWATPTEQGRNTRQNVVLNIDGESLCVSAWAERVGVSQQLIKDRLRLGWVAKEAVFTPPHPIRKEGVTHDGKTLSVAEWSRVTGLPPSALHYRFQNGWSVEKALTTPPRVVRRRAA
jgi:hypothetical protein